jgi:D-3-phosphoglycerate dehydrogenase
VTAEVIAKADHLKVIGRAGVGVDNIDVAAATKQGIAVVNAPGGNTIAVAEHTMALMLASARNVPRAHASISQGRWQKSEFKGTELYGKTLGLIGLGKIGSAVAERAAAFKMTVLAFDPLIPSTSFISTGVVESELPGLLRQSDFISIHTPLTKQTRNLINETTLNMCRPNLYLINTSRGGIVDEEALLGALEDGRIAGAALDVFEKEPPGEHPLFGSDRVIATPHLGASTLESQDRVAEEIAETVSGFLLHGKADNLINPDALSSEGE